MSAFLSLYMYVRTSSCTRYGVPHKMVQKLAVDTDQLHTSLNPYIHKDDHQNGHA